MGWAACRTTGHLWRQPRPALRLTPPSLPIPILCCQPGAPFPKFALSGAGIYFPAENVGGLVNIADTPEGQALSGRPS